MCDPVVAGLLAALGLGDVPASLECAVSKLGRVRMRLLAMKILRWLKTQHRFGNDRPMALDFEFRWCQELRQLVDLWPELGSLLQIVGDEVTFRDTATREDRLRLRQQVDEAYRPIPKP
jgi:hypothetical protein